MSKYCSSVPDAPGQSGLKCLGQQSMLQIQPHSTIGFALIFSTFVFACTVVCTDTVAFFLLAEHAQESAAPLYDWLCFSHFS